MKTNRFNVAMMVLQILTLGCLLTSQGPGILPAARAQVMDSGAQRQQIVDELKSVNTKLDRLLTVLESGNLQVSTDTPDERKDDRSKR